MLSTPLQVSAWRRYLFIGLFAVLAGLGVFSQQAGAQGTIPPGGTVPGGTLPVPGANQGLVNVIHLAPFDPVIANTSVDVCTQTGTPVAGATGLVYLEQSGYLTLPAGTYDWKVTFPGCGSTVVDIAPFTLFDQSVLTLLIIGDGVKQPFSTVLLVQNGGLSQRLYLPIIAKFP
ncbi:MAG: DUF4397 domain-containing protein [Chloroflexota bacterium]|nr:DUF4397 domain-containing protein [Chloroflexota bacterium]